MSGPFTLTQLHQALASLGVAMVVDPEHRPDGLVDEDIPLLLGALRAAAESAIEMLDPAQYSDVQEAWFSVAPPGLSTTVLLWKRVAHTMADLEHAPPPKLAPICDLAVATCERLLWLAVLAEHSEAGSLIELAEEETDVAPTLDSIKTALATLTSALSAAWPYSPPDAAGTTMTDDRHHTAADGWRSLLPRWRGTPPARRGGDALRLALVTVAAVVVVWAPWILWGTPYSTALTVAFGTAAAVAGIVTVLLGSALIRGGLDALSRRWLWGFYLGLIVGVGGLNVAVELLTGDWLLGAVTVAAAVHGLAAPLRRRPARVVSEIDGSLVKIDE